MDTGLPDMDEIIQNLSLFNNSFKLRIGQQCNKIQTLSDENESLREAIEHYKSTITQVKAEKATINVKLEETVNQLKECQICKICEERSIKRVLTCGHVFCIECASTFVNNANPKCPFCQQKPNGYINLFLN